MNHELSSEDALSVGMYLQTFSLALTEEGIQSCCQISVAGYPEIIRKVAGIPDDMKIICGMSIGFEDKAANVNHIKISRLGVQDTTTFLTD